MAVIFIHTETETERISFKQDYIMRKFFVVNYKQKDYKRTHTKTVQ